jgi:hypothetical protein
MNSHSFDKYLRIVLKHSSNYFSAFSVIFVVVAWFVPITFSAKAQVTVLFGMLCIVYSGFRAWKDVVKDHSVDQGFKIIPKTNAFRPHAFLGDGRVDPKTHFTIDFDFINNRDEVTVLNRPEIIKIITNSDLLNNKPVAIRFKHFPGRIDSWIFPYMFEGNTRISMRCEIDVLITNNDLIYFSQKLNSLKTYEIEFQFTHEDMVASKSVENIKIVGTYDDFKKEVLTCWENKKINLPAHNKANSADAKSRAAD